MLAEIIILTLVGTAVVTTVGSIILYCAGCCPEKNYEKYNIPNFGVYQREPPGCGGH